MKQIIEQRADNNWTKDQDDYLACLIETYRNMDWNTIAESMSKKFKESKRTEKECRSRWRMILGADGKKLLWSDRERYLLLTSHLRFKNRWSEIAQILHKANRNLIKNRFYTLFRKIRNRVKNNDVHINSPLDLLEIYYVLQLVEQYFNAPIRAITEEKNYAHKLVQRMDKKKVIDYKVRVTDLYSNKGTIDDLFKECGKLYGEEGSTAIHEDACNHIDLEDNEEKTKITLPCPKDFDKEKVMSIEEKADFWRCVFNKQACSAQIPYSARNSVSSSLFSQVQSAGSMAMRDDEAFGFSQFINPYEGKDGYFKLLLSFSANSPNTQLSYASSPFQPLPRAQKPGDHSTGYSFQPVHSPSAFTPFSSAYDVQPIGLYPLISNLKTQWN
jgi:hypothetical protein